MGVAFPAVQCHSVPPAPEILFFQVLAIPLARKPLFPGTMVPLQVTDKKLLDELVEQHNQGRQGIFPFHAISQKFFLIEVHGAPSPSAWPTRLYYI